MTHPDSRQVYIFTGTRALFLLTENQA